MHSYILIGQMNWPNHLWWIRGWYMV